VNIRITKAIQGGTVKAVASKSEAHRLLICAALADGETFIACNSRSEDIDATVRCLEALGAKISHDENGFLVKPLQFSDIENYELDCGESGTTLRLLIPIVLALGAKSKFYMSGRLPHRPLSPLDGQLELHGCILTGKGASPLICEGKLTSGEFVLPGNVSSQFISGLLFALPLLAEDSIIRVTSVLESRPYVDMTLDALRMFGVTIIEDDGQIFRISGNQKIRSPETVKVGGDWSNAAFWLSAGAIGNVPVNVTGLDANSRQGDRAVIDLLKQIPGEINAEDTPDLVPVLAAAASVAAGKTIIRNAGRLRIKESDRLHTVTALLTDLGAEVIETDDGLIIFGKKVLTGGETESFGDHRIAMTAAILSSVCTGNILIKNAEAVNKSYPDFFKDFAALGGSCTEV
jgi:3-phosphoshikimate 1-carboxyvinyltransferase